MTLQRKTPLKPFYKDVAPKPQKREPKPKRCKVCRAEFHPRTPLAVACSIDCAIEHGKKVTAIQKAKQQRQERAQDKLKRQQIKTIPQLKAEAQKVFNEYIRLRDAGLPCICCGKFATAAALSQPGGAYDACHFRSRGSADHLRYNEDNVWRGLKDCNTWGHHDYRGGLIKRIGLERVEALENDNAVVKWTHEGLEALKRHYQLKIKELKHGQHDSD